MAVELATSERLPMPWWLVLAGFVGAQLGAGFLIGQWRWLALPLLFVPGAGTAAALSDSDLLAAIGAVLLTGAGLPLLALGIGSAKVLGRLTVSVRSSRVLAGVAVAMLAVVLLPLPIALVQKHRTVRFEGARPRIIDERGARSRPLGSTTAPPACSQPSARGDPRGQSEPPGRSIPRSAHATRPRCPRGQAAAQATCAIASSRFRSTVTACGASRSSIRMLARRVGWEWATAFRWCAGPTQSSIVARAPTGPASPPTTPSAPAGPGRKPPSTSVLTTSARGRRSCTSLSPHGSSGPVRPPTRRTRRPSPCEPLPASKTRLPAPSRPRRPAQPPAPPHRRAAPHSEPERAPGTRPRPSRPRS